MSTTAGEETSSDGSGVTMTAPESARTDEEMTGTTGQQMEPSSPKHCLLTVCLQCCAVLCLCSWLVFSTQSEPESGTEAGNVVVVGSTGIMTEAGGRGSPRRDTTWVPSRNAWGETGEMSTNDSVFSLCSSSSWSLSLKTFALSLPGMIMVATPTEEVTTWVTVAEEAPAMDPRSTGATLICISCSLITASPYKRGEGWCD